LRPADFPAVGDWVVLERGDGADAVARVHAVLPRRSVFSRGGGDGSRDAGARTAGEQVVAANVDFVFLVSGLDDDLNLRRIERYLALAWSSGAEPVVVLNKADRHPDVDAAIADVAAAAPGVPVRPVSALTRDGVDGLRDWLGTGRTGALLGSSGVGKSTIVNALIGEERQATGAVREDDSRGRHTTRHRELIVVPGGGLLVDTPGMRSLELLDGDEALDRAFGDIEALAAECRFTDCGHDHEPGCAVRAALVTGELDPARLASYRKLEREVRHAERRTDPRAQEAERRKWRIIHAAVDRQMKAKYGKGTRR
jgi:ribosome biogenesis GTPase